MVSYNPTSMGWWGIGKLPQSLQRRKQNFGHRHRAVTELTNRKASLSLSWRMTHTQGHGKMMGRPGFLVFMTKDEQIHTIKNYTMAQVTQAFYKFIILLRVSVLMLQSPRKKLLATCDC